MDEKDRSLKDLNDKLRVEQDEKMQIVEERQQLEVDMNKEIETLKVELSQVQKHTEEKESGKSNFTVLT